MLNFVPPSIIFIHPVVTENVPLDFKIQHCNNEVSKLFPSDDVERVSDKHRRIIDEL